MSVPPTQITVAKPTIQTARDFNSRLMREYVAAGAPAFFSSRQALPIEPDDISGEFGLDVYAKMLYDSQVAACVTFWKAAILEEGVELRPAIESPQEDGYKKAVELGDAARAMFDQLPISLDDVLWDMLNSIVFGNKVAELVYEIRDNRLDIARIKVKPSRAVAMVVDQFMNLIGLLGAKPNQGNLNVFPSALVSEADIIPIEKFAILSHRIKDADPRGTSILRPAYQAWWRKQTLFPDYIKFLAQFAGPSVIGYTPEDVTIEEPGEDADGNALETLTPEEAMLSTLVDWRNGSAAAFPGGSKVEVFRSEGEGKAFIAAFAMSNLEMTKAILTQELATEQGEYMARAAAQVHQDVLDTLIRQGKHAVIRMMYFQVLRRWVNYNYGAKMLPLTPKPWLGDVEAQDLTPLMTAVAALMRAAYFSPEQLPAIDKIINLPIRSGPSMAEIDRNDKNAQLDKQLKMQEKQADNAAKQAEATRKAAEQDKQNQQNSENNNNQNGSTQPTQPTKSDNANKNGAVSNGRSR